MNALVTFRANSTGNLVASREERLKAAESVSSNLRAKLTGELKRLTAAKSAETTASGTAAKAASAAKSSDDSSDSSTRTVNKELDKDTFLQLLVMQMQYQDPLEPVENTEMIAQLAQFSSLEQMNNLNETFEAAAAEIELLSGNIDQLNFISAQGLLGKYVEGVDADRKAVSGTVDAVTLENSIVVLTVGEHTMPMTGVTNIAQQAPEKSAGS